MRNNSEVTYHGAWGAPPIPKKPPPWEEASKTPVKPQRNLGEILREFGENTTAHGVPMIARSKRAVTKIFWLAVFLTMLVIFCWQGTSVLVEYLGFPSTTKVKLVTNPELTFPSVTICNMNRFRRSKIAGTRFDGLIRLDGGLTDDGGNNDYSWWFDWDSVWYNEYMGAYMGTSNTAQTSSVGTNGVSVPTEGSGLSGDETSDQLGVGTLTMPDTETEAESSVVAITDLPASSPTGRTTISASNGITNVSTSTQSGSSEQVILTNDNGSEGEDITEAGTGAGFDGSASDTSLDYSPTLDFNQPSVGEGITVTTVSSAPTATFAVNDVTTMPVMTSDLRDETTTDETIAFETTPAKATQSTASTDGANVNSPIILTPVTSTTSNSGTTQTPTMASSGVENGITAVGLSTNPSPSSDAPFGTSTSSQAINSESPPATTTTIDTGTESGTPQQLPGNTAPTSHQPPETTGFSGRKKRSLRQIRDAGIETTSASAGNNIMEVIGEFGSWVNQEWNDGGSNSADFDFQYEQYFDWGDLEDENDWASFYERSTSPDYSDFIDIVNPTREELKTLGHQAKDMILQCTFDKKLCSYRDFYQFQNKEYGNCFTFNHGQNLTAVDVTKNAGAQYGLHLTLFLEMPEYVGILSPEAGVRVAIHSHTTPPFPEDDGITASPGMATNIGLRQVYVERLGRPHNTEDCRPFTSNTYSRKACYKECVQEEMYKRCHCVSDILLENKTKCSYIKATQQKCQQLVKYLGEQKKLNCECPIACNETTYTKAVSSTHWPSERYEEHLQRRLQEDPDSAFAARMASSEESTNKNLVRVRVYFEELNYQSILERPLYTFPNLLGNVGGLLGLYIGVSFLTLAEVVALIFHIFKYLGRKLFVKEKVSPTPAVA
ncbi:uncharacterized protein LOC119741792 [Patiria miniata]|uniref:Amiloride-sensitive sodium channel subunit alpha n=1 Tax=Patiria miniata TaxID=46514 RepID=A0A914BC65_PATMI|nr:uncharacterized protein LOC119741792 [Patiria miniata]